MEDSAAINNINNSFEWNKGIDTNFNYKGIKSKKSFDSTFAANPSSFNFIEKPIINKIFNLQEKGISKGEIFDGFLKKTFQNLPKALFIYLPIFALFLWIFHKKKKWWYFDHGIFTLHYFSFLLLDILFVSFLIKLAKILPYWWSKTIIYIIIFILLTYSVIYFFIAHKKVYKSHGLVSFIISSILFFINWIAFSFLLIGLGLISFLMI